MHLMAALSHIQDSRQASLYGKCFGFPNDMADSSETLNLTSQAYLSTSSQLRRLTRSSAVMEGVLCSQSLSLLGMASLGLLPQAMQRSDQASQPSALARLSTITTSKQSSFLLRH